MMQGERRAGRVMQCRRCHRLRTTHGRGLCKRCWAVARDEYQTMQPAERGPGEATDNRGYPLPALPTAYRPGSAEKVAVMANRVARGVQPHHPMDGRL